MSPTYEFSATESADIRGLSFNRFGHLIQTAHLTRRDRLALRSHSARRLFKWRVPLVYP